VGNSAISFCVPYIYKNGWQVRKSKEFGPFGVDASTGLG